VDLDQEGRRDDHLATWDAETPEVLGGGHRIGNVLEHLLADHDVEAPLLGERRAEIEVRVVEAHVVLPPGPRVVVAADLHRLPGGWIELGDPPLDRAVEPDPLPVLARIVGRRIERPVPQPTQRGGDAIDGAAEAQNSPRQRSGIRSTTIGFAPAKQLPV
jgi:hypothetical protein